MPGLAGGRGGDGGLPAARAPGDAGDRLPPGGRVRVDETAGRLPAAFSPQPFSPEVTMVCLICAGIFVLLVLTLCNRSKRPDRYRTARDRQAMGSDSEEAQRLHLDHFRNPFPKEDSD